MQKSRRTLLSICAHPHPLCLSLISIIHFFLFFHLSIKSWFVIGWLQFSTGRTGWFASQTPPLGVAGEIFQIQKISSCKVAHPPMYLLIAILQYCSRCALNVQHDTQEEEARTTNINKEAEEKKPWCCRRMISY